MMMHGLTNPKFLIMYATVFRFIVIDQSDLYLAHGAANNLYPSRHTGRPDFKSSA